MSYTTFTGQQRGVGQGIGDDVAEVEKTECEVKRVETDDGHRGIRLGVTYPEVSGPDPGDARAWRRAAAGQKATAGDLCRHCEP